jgi:hypothetical protein
VIVRQAANGIPAAPEYATCCSVVPSTQETTMSDNTDKRGGQDRERINVNEDHELRDWARKFDATPQQIKEAVQAVGDRAEKVEMHLKGSHSTSNSERMSNSSQRPSKSPDRR